MYADLSKFEEFLQDRTVILANRICLLELSELVLVSSVSTSIECGFGRVEFEIDEFVVDRREGEDRFAILVFRVLRSSESEMSHEDLESFGSEVLADLRVSFAALVRLDQSSDVLIPNCSIGERLESNEFDEGEDIVESVLKGSSGKADSARGREVASGFRLNRSMFFDDAVKSSR